MSEPLQLPEAVLKQLIEAANAAGTTAVEWIQARLPIGNGGPPIASDDEINLADARLDQCVIHLGYQTGLNNDQIDAELAAEYQNTHENASFNSGRS